MYTQAHLACDPFDAIGLTVPGVPGFPHFAHNGSVAWSVTHAFADIHDLFVDRSPPMPAPLPVPGRLASHERPHASRSWWPAPTRSTVQIVETHHGPVVAGDPAQGAALTLRSMQFAETDRSFDCLLPMLRARTAAELFAACEGWGLIDHNLVAADTAGSIGHRVRAIVPRPSPAQRLAAGAGLDGRARLGRHDPVRGDAADVRPGPRLPGHGEQPRGRGRRATATTS